MKSYPGRWYDAITFNIYWFAITSRAQVLTPIVLPLLVQNFVGESSKGAYLGNLRLWGLMMALLVQAVIGMLSDRSSFRWGRRRPFIFAGSIGEIIVFILIGYSAGLDGLSGYWVLFGVYIFSMVSSNTAQAAAQGIIPDLVPAPQRGLFSGIKTLFEVPLPLIFVSLVIGKLIAAGSLWGALLMLCGVMLISMLITMLIPEVPLTPTSEPFNWRPILRLLLMTAVFTGIILVLGQGIKMILPWAAQLPPVPAQITAGGLGLLSMVIAIGLGVWSSIRISLGGVNEGGPAFTWWVLNRLTFLAGATNVAGFLLFFLQEKFPELAGEKAAEPAARLVLIVGVFLLALAVPSGWLSDRFGRKPLIAASGLLAGAGTFVVMLTTEMAGIYIGGSLIGAGIGIFYAANWALGTDLVPKEGAGRFLGISNLAGAGAGAVGAYLGGPIADSFSYTLVIGIYGLLFLLSLIALAKINPPHRP
ncbi:MAG: MFS transporter [Chloroflexota bacterium]